MTGDNGGTATLADRRGGLCLNCGTRRLGEFCHVCGQGSHVHRSLGAIWHDLAHGAFHFEGRMWRTLPLLVFRPGDLTRRYIHGERARFVSPLALFLFIVFVLFAMLSVVGAHLEWEGDGSARAPAAMAAAIARNGEQIASLAEQRARATTRVDIARIDARLAERRRETSAMQAAIDARRGDFPWLRQLRTGWKRLDKGLDKASENPNLILYKLQSNAYKFAWALIPLSLPFLWLLFPFSRRFTAYDHAVFVTYSLCFVSLLLIAMSLLGMTGVGTDTLFLAACVLVPLHMYKQLRGAYGIGRFGAFARTAMLFLGASLATTFFALLLVGLGLVG